jgi:serine kinase of HPr protein (carbohydrate metabolism regulator)
MKLKEIVEKLQLQVLVGQNRLDGEVTGGYTSDLLSDVMANSKAGNLWITLQTHQNIIAVAKLKDLAGIIIVNNRKPDEETLQKAKEENVPLLCTEEIAFRITGKLFALIGS